MGLLRHASGAENNVTDETAHSHTANVDENDEGEDGNNADDVDGADKEEHKAEDGEGDGAKERKKSLAEELDEDGFAKSSLQHAILYTYRKYFARGGLEVDVSTRGEEEDALKHLDSDDEMDNDDAHIEKDESITSMENGSYILNGGLLIISSSGSSETFVTRYAFADLSHTELASPKYYCMEVALGDKCPSSLGTRVAPRKGIFDMGRNVMYPPDENASMGSFEEGIAAGTVGESPFLGEDIHSSPLYLSVNATPQGVANIQLCSVHTGEPVFAVSVRGP
jgi:hypothetical protein